MRAGAAGGAASAARGTRCAAGILPVLIVAAGCGGGAAGPEGPVPAAGYGGIPDLSGRVVLLLPTQSILDGVTNPDPELAFAVEEAAGRVRWVLPRELRQALSRSPGVPSDPQRLPVGNFFRAEVRRVGDPLFGDLRRLGALAGADAALIPLQARYSPGVEGGVAVVELAATLIEIRTGRVYWYGVLAEQASAPNDPAALARLSAALVGRVAR